MSIIKPLVIGNKTAAIPIIQGGMGVGVSLGRLAGAVAKEGGIGIISTAQIGFYRDDFETNTKESNLCAITEQVNLARKLSQNNGLIGVNVMTALEDYKQHVIQAAKAGVDVIICGAGLPLDLPELVKDFDVKIAPIVSSVRAARIIFKKWLSSYKRLPDFVVIEGPKAGGHLGFKSDEVTPAMEDAKANEAYDEEIKDIIEFVNQNAIDNNLSIPVVVAGGIWDHQDIVHAFELGASGVQMATRFICTDECDASKAYKDAHIRATADDLRIIKSPVGMPGRAINNSFLKSLAADSDNDNSADAKPSAKVNKCYRCIAKCNPAQIPYCITQRLINAVKGDVDNGLIFSGSNAGKMKKIVPVHELICELING